MSRGISISTLIMLLVFCSAVFSEEEIPREGFSPTELEALRQHNKGTESMLANKFKEAIFYFKKAIEFNPGFTEAFYNLGITYEKLGKYKDSIEVLKRVIQLKPDHANAHYAQGYAYYKLKKYNDAVAAFKQSIKIKPDNSFAHSTLGHVYILMGDKEAAREHYEILKTLDSTLASELYHEIIKGKK